MNPAMLLSVQCTPDAGDTRWQSVVTHTHLLRTSERDPADVPAAMRDWTDCHHIGAMGMGSPWTHEVNRAYHRCENEDRDRYEAGVLDRASVMCTESVQRLMSQLEHAPCCFYLDNETPKARYGHLWYFAWKYLWPAFHDYSQDRPVWYNELDVDADINPLTGKPHRRRAYMEAIHEQRRHGALAVWAHPTSWWESDQQFVSNIAAELPLHLHADGYIDGMAIMGYHAWRPSYLKLWYALLDTGAVVPGFAEMDACFDQARPIPASEVFVTRMPIADRAHIDAIRACARQGLAYATSGPHITMTVDGAPMGSRVATRQHARHVVRVEARPAPGTGVLSRVELIGSQGTVLGRVDHFSGGVITWGLDGTDARGWVLARCWGEGDDPDSMSHTQIVHFATTNPVYLVHGAEFTAVQVDYVLRVRAGSPWVGGIATFRTPDGLAIDAAAIRHDQDIRVRIPGNAKVTLTNGSNHHEFYISSEDIAVQRRMRYIYAGHFRKDFPDVVPGDVPVAAFAIADLRQDLARASHTI